MSRKRVLKQFGGGPRFESGRSQPDFLPFFLHAMRGPIPLNGVTLSIHMAIFFNSWNMMIHSTLTTEKLHHETIYTCETRTRTQENETVKA